MQEPFFYALIVEVVAAIVAHPIIAALDNAARRWRHTGGNDTESHLWDTLEVLGYVVLMLALFGAVLMSLGVTSALYGMKGMADWSLSFAFTSWAIYLGVATVIGYFSLQVLSVMKAELALAKTRRRHQIFVLSVLAKLGGLLFFAGWILMPSPTSLAVIVSASYLVFIGIDAVAFILIMLVD